ncbi:MAG TPA: hypothetical protein VL625_10075 [Patescibacteria group bacterium]|nr:hypothetical protein [Patescibacteria group bacterium]
MTDKVPVSIWAKDYVTSNPIGDAEIVDLPTGERWKTGADGYAHVMAEPGRIITPVLEKEGYPRMQGPTVTIPPDGLNDADHEITLQVPGNGVYRALMTAFGKPQPGRHHVVTTVSALGKNLHDDEGEKGVSVTLRSADGASRNDAVYLGTFLGKTEWIRPILSVRLPFLRAALAHKATSFDGGAIFMNVPPGDYIFEARKNGVTISSAAMTIYPNSPNVINVSPPWGPKVKGPAPSGPSPI